MGGIKSLSPEEQSRWATQLVHRSDLGNEAYSAMPAPGPASEAGAGSTGVDNGADANPNPLQGVRFPPMSGPGPYGSRPEHTRELLSIRRRSVAKRYLRLLAKLIEMGLSGTLPYGARWILG